MRSLGRLLIIGLLGTLLSPVLADPARAGVSTTTIDFDAPADLAIGGPAENFTGTLDNSEGPLLEGVRFDFVLTGPEGFDAADIVLEFEEPPDSAGFEPIPLADGGAGVVTGSFGPSTGFDVPAGAVNVTNFRVTATESAPAGTVTIDVALVHVDETGTPQGDPIATDTDETLLFEAETQMGLAASPNPAIQGQNTLLVASVQETDEADPDPTGTVEFRLNGVAIGSAPVQPNGLAALEIAFLVIGDHVLTAHYSGDANYAADTSNPVALRVLPADRIGRYIDAVYRLVLGRGVDPSGLNFWRNRINSGLSRTGFAQELLRTDESRIRICTGLYTRYLDRQPDQGGLFFCVAGLRNFIPIAGFSAFLLGSDEFFAQAGGTNSGFLDRLYPRVLGRTADPSGKAFWLGRLAQGVSRQSVALSLLNSAEGRAVVVDQAYFGVLGRLPDPGGRAFWTNQLQSGLREEDLLAILLGSEEFFAGIE